MRSERPENPAGLSPTRLSEIRPEEREAMERRAMLSAPLTKLERESLVEFTGAEHCDHCRLSRIGMCSACCVKLRWEATVRELLSEVERLQAALAALLPPDRSEG